MTEAAVGDSPGSTKKPGRLTRILARRKSDATAKAVPAGYKPFSNKLAPGLIALGVQPEQRVAVASSTRMEWVECYLAAVLAAAEHVAAEREQRGVVTVIERLERGLGRRPVRVGIWLDEGRLRDELVGAPQRHAAPDAQRSSAPVGVDDRPRIPRPAAQHERAGREGLGASCPRQVEGQMRDEEVETSHGRGSFDRGPRAGGGWVP